VVLSYQKNKIATLKEILIPPLHPPTMIFFAVNFIYLPESVLPIFRHSLKRGQKVAPLNKLSDIPIPHSTPTMTYFGGELYFSPRRVVLGFRKLAWSFKKIEHVPRKNCC
jgi:hypothetical protein